MKATLQSCLECLDRHNDKIISVYREMLELRTRIMELLDSVQSEATVMDSGGTRDGNAYLQENFDNEPRNIVGVALDDPNTIFPPLPTFDPFGSPQPLVFYGGFSDQEHGPIEFVGIKEPLPEDTDLMICQSSPGKFPVIFSVSF
ncbi:hypothetical protein P692DRAFT_20838967 [Suillus brevipes Sb2]|nr:hypothetical protein P692DRAFT_20838967 [Suillus brevipes Sb2]